MKVTDARKYSSNPKNLAVVATKRFMSMVLTGHDASNEQL
jgi:hypothetical protein